MERYPSFFPPAPASELGLGDLPSLPRAPWQSEDEPPVPRASDAPRIQAFPDAGLGVANTRRARSPQQGDAQAILDRALEAEGAWELRPVAQAILMQESGARAGIRDSVDGAAGMMQVMPDTFRMVMGNEGDIRNPYDNARAAVRYMKRLNKYAKGDAARIAVGYFSGEGNINTSPDGTPYKHDRADGNGKRVSEYQSDVMRRINGSNGVDAPVRGTQQGHEMPGLDNAFSVAPSDIASIPKWSDIAKSDEYKRLPVKAQLEKKAQYFDLVAPHLAAEGENVEEMRRKFLYSVDDHRSGLEKTGNTLQNVAAGALKIGPTAVKGLANLGDMLTGGAVDWGGADAMERGMKSIDSTVGSDHLAKQQAVFGQLMQDENAGIADMAQFAAQNPGMLANEATATVGSMLLPAGVAGAAAKVANTAKLAKGASAAVAKSAATKAATRASLATVGAQNAAETFSETKDAELADRYKAAAISGAVSLLAGMALGGGAEGMIARRLAGDLQKGAPGAMSRAGAFLANIGKEAGQESLEELGGILGEWAGTGERPNATNAGKQMAYAGLLGGLMGGGAHFASDGISPVTGDMEQSDTDSEGGQQNGAGRVEPSMPGLDAVNSTYADDGEDGGAGGAQISEENARALQDAIAQDLARDAPGVDLNLSGQKQQQSKHPTEQTAEAIVEELAMQAGIPLETVLPQRVAQAQADGRKSLMQNAADTTGQTAALDERSVAQGEQSANLSEDARGMVTSAQNAGQSAPRTVAQGAATEIILPGGEQLAAQWQVVEADEVTAAMREGVAQPRDRTRAASNAQVRAIAQNPDFARLSDTAKTMDYGAPTLTMEGAIVGGNGRFAGVQAAYAEGGAADYRARLEEKAASFGIDPAQVRGMKRPVLVRRLNQAHDTRALAIASNQGAGLQMSPMEQAAVDAERMTGLHRVKIDENGNIALTQENRAAIADALRDYSTEEVAQLVQADGSLSQAGVNRAKAAILYSAYGKSDVLARLLESTDADMRNVGTALTRAAGLLAEGRREMAAGKIPAEYDIAADLEAAVSALADIRARGVNVAEYLAQSDMFGGLTKPVRTILSVMAENIRSAKTITRFLREYAAQVRSVANAGDGLFGKQRLPEKEEVLNDIAERIQREQELAGRASGDLFGQGSAGNPESGQTAGRPGGNAGAATDVGENAARGLDGQRGRASVATAEAGENAPGRGRKPRDGSKDAWRFQTSQVQPDAESARILQGAPVAGVSRDNGVGEDEGTHNYVIWDESLLTPEAANIRALFARRQWMERPDARAGLFVRGGRVGAGVDAARTPSRRAGDRGAEVNNLDAVAERFNTAIARAGGAPRVVLVASFADLPQSVQRANAGADGEQVQGVFHDGRVFVVRDAIETAGQMEAVILHELYGHAGLRALFGEDIYSAMNRLASGLGRERMAQMMRRHGFDGKGYSLWARDAAENASQENPVLVERIGGVDALQRALLMEEVLAHEAQGFKQGDLRRIAREIVGAVRSWLREHGLAELASINGADIAYVLRQAREAAMSGKQGVIDIPVFQRGWHGSPKRFRYFSLDHIGSGEGAQVHGWGLYVSLDRNTAQYRYKDRLEEGTAYYFNGDFVLYDDGEWIWNADDENEANALDHYDNATDIKILETAKENDAKSIDEVIEYLEEEKDEIENGCRKYEEEHWKKQNLTEEEKAAYEKHCKARSNLVDFVGRLKLKYGAMLSGGRDALTEEERTKLSSLEEEAKKHPDPLPKKEIPPEAREEIEENYRDTLEDEEGYEEVCNALEAAKKLAEEGVDLTPTDPGQLYEVDIPEDDVMLREEADLADQPQPVKQALIEILEKVEVFDEDRNAELLEVLRDKENNYAGVTGKEFYEELASGDAEGASRLLNKYGIKGIRYNGEQDGECAVIFDDEAIDIVDTYFSRARPAADADMVRELARAEGISEDEARARIEQAQREFAETERAYGGKAAYDAAKKAGKTKLNYRQWVQVRMPAFKAWFGDWQAVRGARQLQQQKPLNLDGVRTLANKAEAKSVFKAFGEVTNDTDGQTVRFPVETIGKLVGLRRFFDALQIAGAFDRLFKGAVPMYSEGETLLPKHKDHTGNIAGYHHYLNRFELDGRTYYVRFTARESVVKKDGEESKNFVHSAVVSDIEIYDEKGAIPEPARATDNRILTGKDAPLHDTVAEHGEQGKREPWRDKKLANWLDAAKRGASAVVDEETGEPMVVYHGTDADFSVFDIGKFGQTDSGWYGKGFYFTPSTNATFAEDAAYERGGNANVMPVFLNIRKPVYGQHYAERGSDLVASGKERGRDGVIVRYEADHEEAGQIAEIVATDPTQIKSATGNVGLFGQRNPDIRFARDAGLNALAQATMQREAYTLEDARSIARREFVGHKLTNADTGQKATLSASNLRKMTSEKAHKKSANARAHAMAVANADALFEAALLDHSHEDKNGEPTIAAIHRFVAPMVFDGRVLAVKMTVKETTSEKNPNPIYSIEAIDVENPPSVLSRAEPDATGIRPQAGFSEKVLERLAEVKRALSDPASRRTDFAREEAAGAPSRGRFALTAGGVRRVVRQALQGVRNAPRVEVVETVAELPFSAPSDAQGAFHNGRVWLVAENLKSAQEAREVLAHEMIGHYGLRGFFGRGLDMVLNRIHANNARVRQMALQWRRDNADLIRTLEARGVSREAIRARSIEEALAQMAQAGEKLTGWKMLAGFVQNLLRKIGAHRLANMLEARTDAEALTALKQAEMFVRDGLTANDTIPNGALAAFERARAVKWADMSAEEVAAIPLQPVRLRLEGWKGSSRQLSALAREVYASELQGTGIDNASMGADVKFSAEGKGEAFGARDKLKYSVRAEVVRVLRQLVHDAVKVSEAMPDGRRERDSVAFHTLLAPLQVNGGEMFAARITVREARLVPEGETPHRFYDVALEPMRQTPIVHGFDDQGGSSRPASFRGREVTVSDLARAVNTQVTGGADTDAGAAFSFAGERGASDAKAHVREEVQQWLQSAEGAVIDGLVAKKSSNVMLPGASSTQYRQLHRLRVAAPQGAPFAVAKDADGSLFVCLNAGAARPDVVWHPAEGVQAQAEAALAKWIDEAPERAERARRHEDYLRRLAEREREQQRAWEKGREERERQAAAKKAAEEVNRAAGRLDDGTQGYIHGNDHRPYTPPTETLTEAQVRTVLEGANKVREMQHARSYDKKPLARIRSFSVFKKSKNIPEIAGGFVALAESLGWKASRSVEDIGSYTSSNSGKYLSISRPNPDFDADNIFSDEKITIDVRISDHARTTEMEDFYEENAINLVPSNVFTQSGFAYDTFESALWKLKNARVNERGSLFFGDEEAVYFSRAGREGEPAGNSGGLALNVRKAARQERKRFFGGRSIEQLMRDYDALPDADGGHVINADIARTLSPQYRDGSASADDVQNAVSELADRLFKRDTARPVAAGREALVVFTAGGSGAGKSAAVAKLITTAQKADIVFDGTFSDADRSVARVKRALASGRGVEICFVYRTPANAAESVIKRANETRRTVPMEKLVKSHVQSLQTVKQVLRECADAVKHEKLSVTAIDNNGARIEDARVFESIDQVPEETQDAVREQFKQALVAARAAWAGSDDGRVQRAGSQEPQDGRPDEGRAGNAARIPRHESATVSASSQRRGAREVADTVSSTLSPALYDEFMRGVQDAPLFARGHSGQSGTLAVDAAQVRRAPPKETRAQWLQRKFQDKLNRFTVIRKWLESQGVKLTEQANVYGAEERMHGRFANKVEDFQNKRVRPLVEKITRAGFSMDDVAQFLHAQHAEERNAQVAKINPRMPDGGSGMTNADARAILAAAKPELRQLANEFRAITDDTLKILVNAGIVDANTADAYRRAYQHYVPLKGGPDSDAANTGTGKGLNVRHKNRRALGHNVREGGEWIIQNIIADHQRALMLAEKNRVAQHLVMMGLQAGRPDLITINEPQKRQVLQQQTSYEVWHNGTKQAEFSTQRDAQAFRNWFAAHNRVSTASITVRKTSDPRVALVASPQLADNEVIAYVRGHEVRVQIHDEVLAQAYKNMGSEAMVAILRAGAALNAYFSRVYTGYNPEFIVTNIVRDFSSGLLNITGEHGLRIAGRALKNYASSFRELFRYARTNEPSKWIEMYRADGGNTGAAYLSDLERIQSELQSTHAQYAGVAANVKRGDYANALRAARARLFDATLAWIERLNQAGENAMRLAVYRAMVEDGQSRELAASAAKNATVNFNRKGELGKQLNALYLFYNAGVQGTAAIAHAAIAGKHRKQLWAMLAGVTMLGYLAALAAGDDDDYETLPEWERQRNILLPMGDGFAKIPLPYGYGFFWNLGRGAAEAERTGQTDKLPWHLAASFVEEFTPFGSAVAGDKPDAKQAALYLAPTVYQIPGAVLFNRSGTGREIRPENPYNKFEHDRDQMYRATKGTLADDMAGALEAAGLDVSPETLKYLWRTATGGSGAFVQSAADALTLAAAGGDIDVREMPFVRKFVSIPDVRGARSRYYEARRDAEAALAEFNRAKKHNDVEGARAIVAKQRHLLLAAKVARRQDKFIRDARDRYDAVRLSDRYTLAEKRAIMHDMERAEKSMYDTMRNMLRNTQ